MTKQVHPARELTAPSGALVNIDRGLVPLIQALWEWGATTLQSCQDTGVSILHGGWDEYPPERRVRHGRFWDSYAWVQLTRDDGARLINLTEDLAHGGDWERSIPALPGPTVPVVDILFPNWQLGDVERAVRRAIADADKDHSSPASSVMP